MNLLTIFLQEVNTDTSIWTVVLGLTTILFGANSLIGKWMDNKSKQSEKNIEDVEGLKTKEKARIKELEIKILELYKIIRDRDRNEIILGEKLKKRDEAIERFLHYLKTLADPKTAKLLNLDKENEKDSDE